MAGIDFHDMLYGKITVPDYLGDFIRLPEFLRLRDVRLSNTDSILFKDFGRVSRWEHGYRGGIPRYACVEPYAAGAVTICGALRGGPTP